MEKFGYHVLGSSERLLLLKVFSPVSKCIYFALVKNDEKLCELYRFDSVKVIKVF